MIAVLPVVLAMLAAVPAQDSWQELQDLVTGTSSAAGGGVSADPGTSNNVSLVLDAAGFPVVAWGDASSGNSEIYVRRWNGRAWQELRGSATGGGISNSVGESSFPSLALDRAGNPVVAWAESSPDLSGILVSRWDPATAAWVGVDGGPLPANVSAGSGLQWKNPSLALDAADRPVVAWSQDVGNATFQTYVRRWNGSAWVEYGTSGSGNGVSNVSTTLSTSWPSLALDSGGNPTVAWTSGAGYVPPNVYLRRWDGTAWIELGSSGHGTGVSDFVTVVTGIGQLSPYVVVRVDAQGRPYVAWSDNRSGCFQVYLRRWTGSAWAGMEDASSVSDVSIPDVNSKSPSLRLDASGAPVVAWWGGPTGVLDIFLRRWDSGAKAWLALAGSDSGGGLSATTALSYFPSLAIDAFGSPAVAWADGIGTASEIYFRRYIPPPTAPLVPAAPAQFEADGETPVSAGAAAVQANGFVAKAGVIDANGDDVRLQVEAAEVGVAFSGVPIATGPAATSGTLASVPVPLLPGRAYHWQLRSIDATQRASAWVPFGSSPDVVSEVDLSIPVAMPPAAGDVVQVEPSTGRVLGSGGTTFETAVILRAGLSTSMAGRRVRLEVELRPLGVVFLDLPTGASPLVNPGTIVDLVQPLNAPGSHWQYRAVDSSGNASAWTAFGGNAESAADLTVVPAGSTGLAACIGAAPAAKAGAWMLIAALLAARRRISP